MKQFVKLFSYRSDKNIDTSINEFLEKHPTYCIHKINMYRYEYALVVFNIESEDKTHISNSIISDICHVVTDNTLISDNDEDYSHLPTSNDYRQQTQIISFQNSSKCLWSEPKYQCPDCGGGMCKNLMKVFTSYPVQYEYRCNKCGKIEFQYM